MKVVLDTNVLVSALIKPSGLEAAVVMLALRSDFEMCISPAVFAEYESVLPRPELKLDPREVEATLANVRKVARLVHPTRTLKVSGHEADNRFLECADAAAADYLVTGNTKHFPMGHGKTETVTSRQFLEFLAHETGKKT